MVVGLFLPLHPSSIRRLWNWLKIQVLRSGNWKCTLPRILIELYRYKFSEQQLIDCSGAFYGNYGCGGGFYTGGWEYVKSAPGIATTPSYPYRGSVIIHLKITPSWFLILTFFLDLPERMVLLLQSGNVCSYRIRMAMGANRWESVENYSF